MKNAIVVGFVVLAVGGIAACKDEKAGQKFCAAAAKFDTDLTELKAIGPHSTVAELRAATDRTDDDVVAMQKYASRMDTPAAKRFTAATQQLKRDTSRVPAEATLEQVYATIDTDVQNARAAGDDLAKESGCPLSARPTG